VNNHFRRVVCDVDDTLSFTTNRDWASAVPNSPVIEKINYLHDQGWEVYLVTARGQVSCDGDSQKASDKYRLVLEKWLQDNNVKYDLLSFEKHLGAYYVDDKALRPEELVALRIEPLTSGRSGALVERRGDRVYKTHLSREAALKEANWYSEVSSIFTVPHLHSVIDRTVCVEYIKPIEKPVSLDFLKSAIQTMQTLPALKRTGTLTDFLKDVGTAHRETLKTLELEESFQNILARGVHSPSSLCHGDFTLENILPTTEGFVLIDPLVKDSFSSWVLDASKMLMSLRKHGKKLLFHAFRLFLSEISSFTEEFWISLELVQWIRVYKYFLPNEKEYVIEIVSLLKKELK